MKNSVTFFRKTFIFLPLIYIGFSLIGDGNDSFYLELLYGTPFIIAGLYFLKYKNTSLKLLAVFYFLHIIHDYFNEELTNNIGVVFLYREFCILYDFIVGVFLLYYSIKNSN